MRKSLLIVIVAMLIATNLVFTSSTSAHNVDLKKAREIVRDYARKVRDESGGKYVHYSTNCVAAFQNHNHIARCLVEYRNEADTKKGVYTCQELIEISLPPHKDGRMGYDLWANHVSFSECGKSRFKHQLMTP
jgi:hypothetical protein